MYWAFYLNTSTAAEAPASVAMDNKVTVVLGAQWGDEGKGKIVDLIAANQDVICRCQVRKMVR